MASDTAYVPFSNHLAVTHFDCRLIDKQTKKPRAWRVLVDVDAPMHAVFVRDSKGKLPEQPQYMSPHKGLANHYGKTGAPHPEEAVILQEWEDRRKAATEPVDEEAEPTEDTPSTDDDTVTEPVAE